MATDAEFSAAIYREYCRMDDSGVGAPAMVGVWADEDLRGLLEACWAGDESVYVTGISWDVFSAFDSLDCDGVHGDTEGPKGSCSR